MSIEVKDLCFAYGEHEVLHGVSFKAEAGEFLSILGPNGVGKSTLFRCVLGLLRGSAVAVLVMAVLPSALSLVDPSLTAKFVDTSRLYGVIRQFDPLSVTQWISSLVG